MNRRIRGVLVALGMVWLSGCAVGPVDSFTLEVDLPAEFRFKGAANYSPALSETCKLPQRRGKRPERKIFTAQYKPLANRVSYELPLTEIIEGCPSVLRSVEFDFYAKWGIRDSDVGGDLATIYFADRIEAAGVPGAPESGVQELLGQCRWHFRTVGPVHAIRKVLFCRSLDAMGRREKTRAGGVVQRDPLFGKKLRLVLTVTNEELPGVDDNWVSVPGGWKRCKGENFEDLDAYCGGNVTDFKPITMPDGRVCDVYPTCK